MKFQKMLLAAVVGMSSMLGATGVAQADSTEKAIRFGVDPTFPPYEWRDTQGQLQGFDIEVGNAICAHLKVECDWQIINFDGAIPALNSNKIDGILSGFTITEQRAKQVNFSHPIYSSTSRIMTLKDKDFATTAESLKGKRIGIVQGTSQAAYANKHWRGKGIDLISYQNDDLAKQDLAMGRIDGTLQNAAAGAVFFETPEGANFHMTGEAVSDKEVFGVGAGIGLRKSDTALLERINGALEAMVASGQYNDILQRYSKYGISAPIKD